MNKNDVYAILDEQRVTLFSKYCESESKVDKRLTIQNDGVAYSGMDFIKYVPNWICRLSSLKVYLIWSDNPGSLFCLPKASNIANPLKKKVPSQTI